MREYIEKKIVLNQKNPKERQEWIGKIPSANINHPFQEIAPPLDQDLQSLFDLSLVDVKNDPKTPYRPFADEDDDTSYRGEETLKITPPQTLTINLKRFDQQATFIDRKIEGNDTLLLKSTFIRDDSGAKDVPYRLTGFWIYDINHYYAYVKRNDGWYYCNDGTVKKVDINDENCREDYRKRAYIMTYTKDDLSDNDRMEQVRKFVQPKHDPI